jgi:prevent-host-death family protein
MVANSIPWQLQEAKAKLSELVQKTLEEGPQTVTRRGKDSVVVVSSEEYRRLKEPDNDLVTFLRSAPHLELDIRRTPDTGREIDL